LCIGLIAFEAYWAFPFVLRIKERSTAIKMVLGKVFMSIDFFGIMIFFYPDNKKKR
jgi:hypothetical protein